MEMQKKIISVILIMGLIIGSVSTNPTEAKMVEVKTKISNSELKIFLLNEQLDEQLNEVVFKIKNKTKKQIKITKVSIQYKVNEKWTTLKKRKKSALRRKMTVDAESVAYDSVNLSRDYVVPQNGLRDGKYSIYINYKYKGKNYHKRKTFRVKRNKTPEEQSTVGSKSTLEQETTSEEKTTLAEEITSESVTTQCPTAMIVVDNNTESAVTVGKSNNTSTIKLKVVNTDFFIEKTGKASLMVFSEADYKKARKTKIYISVQRKIKGKWKKHKSYKVVKKSNIAFASKQLKLRNKGTYRMAVKIVFYGKGKKRRQYKTKSKVLAY